MKWFRTRYINGSSLRETLPRNSITVLTNRIKSIEVYSMKKVTVEDSGVYRCEVTERGKKRVTHARVLQVKRKYYIR